MDEPVFIRRTNVLPTKASEYPFVVFISIVIPVTYWFEMWVVFPSLFSDNPALYWLFFFLGHFCLHNIVGNFLGILMCDTSIRGRSMPKEDEPGVLYCSICETYTPPRSYHCPSCDICILKRDHHCMFTSCCVGFYNHRFFFFFVFYMMLSTLLCLPFNLYFLWDLSSSVDFTFIFAILLPITILLFDIPIKDISMEYLYMLISLLGIIGVIFCSTWFYFHMKLILKGSIVHEMRKCINVYNLGQEKNLEMVFGKRWHLTWISPYLKSSLICDGVRFPITQNDKVD